MSKSAGAAPAGLPWRGPGPGRPELPLPPGKVPLRRDGRWRKRWRYIGAYCDELLLCAARVDVGPVGQTFWAVWDREGKQMWERTRTRRPHARGEVFTEEAGPHGFVDDLGEQDGGANAIVRIEAGRVDGDELRGFLHPGAGEWVESVCPTEEGNYVWTRKRGGIPVQVDLRAGGRRWRVDALGIEDESCGYHPKHTVWDWSAGVGRSTDGRAVAWNLVSGINDPPKDSERAIWVDGAPSEPGPVTFDGLDAIGFDDGARLAFSAEAERHKQERRLTISYTYRQPFGSFSGSLPGGIELEHGLGVMEHHDAHW